MGANKKSNKKNSKDDKSNKGASDSASSAKSGGNPWSILSYIPKLHKGGKVRKTGVYRLKKGEKVITASQEKSCVKKRGKKSNRKVISKR